MVSIEMKKGRKTSFEEIVGSASSSLAQKMIYWNSSGTSQPFRSNASNENLNRKNIDSTIENVFTEVQQDTKISRAVNEALSRMNISTQKK